MSTTPSTAMASLLKRSDAPLYRVFVGEGCEPFAQQLGYEQCFEVCAILHAPCVASDAEARAATVVNGMGANLKRNGWFEATLEQAAGVLVAMLPGEDETCVATPAPKKRRKVTEPAAAAQTSAPAESIALAEENIPCAEVAGEQTDCGGETSPVSDNDTGAMDVDTDHPLWSYVVPCSTREATKSTEIRARLEEICGKDSTRILLADTKATVAQDPSGKKHRVLKFGGTLVKLK